MEYLIALCVLIIATLGTQYVRSVYKLRKARRDLEICYVHDNPFKEIVYKHLEDIFPFRSPEWKKLIPHCEEVDCMYEKTNPPLTLYRLADIVRLFAGEIEFHEMRKYNNRQN